jgi:hypothetical protein
MGGVRGDCDRDHASGIGPEDVIVVGEPTDETAGKLATAVVFLLGVGGTWWSFFCKKPGVAGDANGGVIGGGWDGVMRGGV